MGRVVPSIRPISIFAGNAVTVRLIARWALVGGSF